MKKLQTISFVTLAAVILFGACKKRAEDYFAVPPAESHFQNSTSGSFYVQDVSNPTFKIPLGITTVADVDRKITVSVSSPTGAAAGAQYNLPSTTVTIPAGKAIDSLTVQGIFAGFPGTRKDTLKFTITGGDVTPSAYNSTYTLVLQKYCPVNLSAFVGAFTKTDDNDGTGFYTTTVNAVTSANQTGPTSGYIMVTGLWGVPGSGPIRVDLDWSDPANFKTSIPTGQPLYVHSTYGQAYVRPNGTGSFSACSNSFTLKYQVYVNAGSFAATTTTMQR